MTTQHLVCAKRDNFDACLDLAREYATGVEVQTFAFPPVFAEGWRDLVRDYQTRLRDIPGPVALHGPFMDLAGGSPDPLINDVVAQRVHESLEVASALEARTVVFHANFIASIHNPEYRVGWVDRQIEFWMPLAEAAWAAGHVIALENMWEFDPDIIGEVLRRADHPGLRACVDVGHTFLFSNVALEQWLARLGDLIVHVHINNNNGGNIDRHQGLDDGVLDYHAILPQLYALPLHPPLALEIEHVAAMRRSLEYLRAVR